MACLVGFAEKKSTFFRISQVKAYERVGKSVSYLKGNLIEVF